MKKRDAYVFAGVIVLVVAFAAMQNWLYKFSVLSGVSDSGRLEEAAVRPWSTVGVSASVSQPCYREPLVGSVLVMNRPTDTQWDSYLQLGIDAQQSRAVLHGPNGETRTVPLAVENYERLGFNDPNLAREVYRGIVVVPSGWPHVDLHLGYGSCTYDYTLVFAGAPAQQPNPNPAPGGGPNPGGGVWVIQNSQCTSLPNAPTGGTWYTSLASCQAELEGRGMQVFIIIAAVLAALAIGGFVFARRLA